MASLGIGDAYKLYKQENPKGKNMHIFITIAEDFNKFIFEKLLEGHEVALPYRCGKMYFLGKKVKPTLDEKGNIKGLAPNWKETLKLWKDNPEAKQNGEAIYFFNEHTNGLRYRLHWTKKNVYIRHKDFYSFRLTRMNKHAFNQCLLENREYITNE